MKLLLCALTLIVSFTIEAKSFKVMQLNVENLFDTKFDQGTEDFTYLPVSIKRRLRGHQEYCDTMSSDFRKDQCLNLDWTDEKFSRKVMNLSRIVRAELPDILVLQEVENIHALNRFVALGLSKSFYQSQVLIEGDDSRGIDVAVVSRFPVISAKHHSLFMDGKKVDTRGILEVTLDVEGKKVVVFANHWPSQANPTSHRIASAQLLTRVAARVRGDLVLAVGDFNTKLSESPYPFNYLTHFIDAEEVARRLNPRLHPGTHFFRGEWSSLDKIFIHKNSSLAANYQSFNILTLSFMMKRDRDTGELIPLRSNHSTGEGYSDHLPAVMEFSF